MKKYEIEYLRRIAKEAGVFDKIAMNKVAEQNPLENSMWENMITGALKALEVIAIATLDWKLTAIVKLLQSWLNDRKKEKEESRKKTEYGYGYKYETNAPAVYDPYGGGAYY